MRILFLDDNIERHKVFMTRSIGCIVKQAYTAAEAIDFLNGETEGFDLVMLDHDLGGQESEDKILDDVEDGRFVVKFIVANADRFSDTTFVVHSLNTVGRRSMVKSLKDVGLMAHEVPFGWTILANGKNGVGFFV